MSHEWIRFFGGFGYCKNDLGIHFGEMMGAVLNLYSRNLCGRLPQAKPVEMLK